MVHELLLSTGKQPGKSNSRGTLKGSKSITSTATLESAFSDAIGVLTHTVIKSDPSNEKITRTQSEIAIRKLLRALQEKFEDEKDDSRSIGSSAASFLADDIASTVIGETKAKMNKYAIGTDTKPDWVKTKSVQVQDDINKQANELLGSIMSELRSPSEKKSSTTILSGETNPSDAMTMVSKLLVHRLIPHLTEHFRPPSPPEKKEVATMKKNRKNPYLSGSSFNDFRKAGILKSDTQVSSTEQSDSKAESSIQEKLNEIAGKIVTAAVKDDRINNVRKQDEIQALVNDLALGIVSNVLDNESKKSAYSSSLEGKLYKGRQDQIKKIQKDIKPQTSSAVLLQRALYAKTKNQKDTNHQISKLADSIVNGMNEKDSGSSRVSSGRTHGDSSEFELMGKLLVNTVPKVMSVSNTEDDVADLQTFIQNIFRNFIS